MPRLVLSRKRNETITIGGDIRVTVLDVDRGKVKIAVEAPAHLFIGRPESPTYAAASAAHPPPPGPDDGFADGILANEGTP